ncbi:hypothetical protein H6F89_33920 [Cyanobacteria bacterium FACHB-63]|nr:hypothetical protein [Cyanobacteria bacterium FACHB-63]
MEDAKRIYQSVLTIKGAPVPTTDRNGTLKYEVIEVPCAFRGASKKWLTSNLELFANPSTTWIGYPRTERTAPGRLKSFFIIGKIEDSAPSFGKVNGEVCAVGDGFVVIRVRRNPPHSGKPTTISLRSEGLSRRCLGKWLEGNYQLDPDGCLRLTDWKCEVPKPRKPRPRRAQISKSTKFSTKIT